ncbi:MAG: hypothetical protein OEL89_02155, partial [Candidatus Peregrinibacteria bacterium]|nr:hypothetical protein [Candidatus Peregrinibacteria bacterium]
KDEKKAHGFDDKLAKILPQLSFETLDFVIFLIDHEVPSLTILAIIALELKEAGKICFAEFHKYIAETADFSAAKFDDEEVEKRISLWWTFIFAADHVSTTTKLREFRKNDKFVTRISKEFSKTIEGFLLTNEVEKFNPTGLKKILKKYADAAFSDNPLNH